jgi:hypothetical protein
MIDCASHQNGRFSRRVLLFVVSSVVAVVVARLVRARDTKVLRHAPDTRRDPSGRAGDFALADRYERYAG